MAKFNATDFKAYLDVSNTATLITDTTSAEISFSAETIDLTTKDNAGWREIIMGLRSGTASISGLADFASTNNVDKLLDAFVNKTKLRFTFKTATTGDTTIVWEGYVTTPTLTAEMETGMQFSTNLEFTGAPTLGTVS